MYWTKGSITPCSPAPEATGPHQIKRRTKYARRGFNCNMGHASVISADRYVVFQIIGTGTGLFRAEADADSTQPSAAKGAVCGAIRSLFDWKSAPITQQSPVTWPNRSTDEEGGGRGFAKQRRGAKANRESEKSKGNGPREPIACWPGRPSDHEKTAWRAWNESMARKKEKKRNEKNGQKKNKKHRTRTLDSPVEALVGGAGRRMSTHSLRVSLRVEDDGGDQWDRVGCELRRRAGSEEWLRSGTASTDAPPSTDGVASRAPPLLPRPWRDDESAKQSNDGAAVTAPAGTLRQRRHRRHWSQRLPTRRSLRRRINAIFNVYHNNNSQAAKGSIKQSFFK